MSVELPFAPVDDVIRGEADGLRVSAGAAEELAARVQREGARRAVAAAQLADEEGRKTLMIDDFGAETVPDKDALVLPVAPIDRVARLDIDDRYRVSMDARIVLAAQLEGFAADVAAAAALLARHADRRTIKAEDIEAYFQLEQYFE
jgi:histone H3/H4